MLHGSRQVSCWAGAFELSLYLLHVKASMCHVYNGSVQYSDM